MPPDTILTKSTAAAAPVVGRRVLPLEETDSLFEHVAWLYAFCRENVFRDDTERIVSVLWPDQQPRPGTKLIELGCGPGFYSRKLARRFPQLSVTGIDRSERQILAARARARSEAIRNCVFERVNALEIPWDNGRFDVLITSRLFTVLRDPQRAIGEMFRVLRPGGRCFIAEPRYAFSASIPLVTMWLLARCSHKGNGYREPRKATVYSGKELRSLIAVQPWTTVEIWHDGRYHYALCQKD